ncbi:MAG: hypothetical protein WBP75_07390, partial [Candidatus Cybelea sp.]
GIPFERTARYARGRILDRLRDLPPGRRISLFDLHYSINRAVPGRSMEEVSKLVDALTHDGLVMRDGTGVALPE